MGTFVLILVAIILIMLFWPYILMFFVFCLGGLAIFVQIAIAIFETIGDNARKVVFVLILGLIIFFIVRCVGI